MPGQQEEYGFPWITARSDSITWEKVRRAFRSEMADTLREVYVADAIERVGVQDSFALVVIRFRDTPTPYKPVYRLYSYSFADGRKALLAGAPATDPKRDLWLALEFDRVAGFEPD